MMNFVCFVTIQRMIGLCQKSGHRFRWSVFISSGPQSRVYVNCRSIIGGQDTYRTASGVFVSRDRRTDNSVDNAVDCVSLFARNTFRHLRHRNMTVRSIACRYMNTVVNHVIVNSSI
jgi:hypothetical protein